jgi:Lamin Tail Domain
MMERINSLLSALKGVYNQQGQIGKILLPSLVLLIVCCLCLVMVSLARSGSSPNAVASPIILPSQVIVATPTALFNFGTVTFAPFPTFPSSTPFPTLTASVTGVPTSTPEIPTATGTAVPLPTLTASQTLPPPTVVVVGSVQIATVDKAQEFVDIQNGSNVPVDLSGWKLVSETGNQSCTLRGLLQPNETLRVWSGKGDSGLSCQFPFNIWNDNQSDPAVLYNAQGQEISRFP